MFTNMLGRPKYPDITATRTWLSDTMPGTPTSTFTSVPIGAADPSRIVVVLCTQLVTGGVILREIDDVPISGLATTAYYGPVGSFYTTNYMWYEPMPTGTTMKLAIGNSSAPYSMSISVWRMLGADPDSPAPYDTDFNTNQSLGNLTDVVSQQIGGVVFHTCCFSSASGTLGTSYLYYPGDLDSEYKPAGNVSQTFGVHIPTITGNFTETYVPSISPNRGSSCSATWRKPAGFIL
jgi:hypothetical protein